MLRKLNKRGFTLVEIMIVVAIIGLLAAIAIPNLLRARLNANESAAKGSLRTLSTAFESYRAALASPAYPSALTDLSSGSPPYIDSVLANGTKQGYTFTQGTTTNNTYSVVAAPEELNATGENSYCVDQTGVIFMGACATGTPIEG